MAHTYKLAYAPQLMRKEDSRRSRSVWGHLFRVASVMKLHAPTSKLRSRGTALGHKVRLSKLTSLCGLHSTAYVVGRESEPP